MFDYDVPDFYDDRDDLDHEFLELKGKVYESIKQDYVKEMERLRKENNELRPLKQTLKNLEEELQGEYRRKANSLEQEYEQKKKEVRNERISELLKDNEVMYWSVRQFGVKGDKCDKCDNNRRIQYKTPSGKDAYESCECDETIVAYEPAPLILYTLNINDDYRGKISAWYKIRNFGKRDEYLNYYEDSLSLGDNFVTDSNQINKDLWYYKAVFETEELANQYCDLMNANESSQLQKQEARAPQLQIDSEDF